MQLETFVCDVCRKESVVDAITARTFGRQDGWFTVTVERAKGWHTQNNIESAGGNAFRYIDAFPGAERWRENVMPHQPVYLDLCSDACVLQAMLRLHEGAVIVAFQGPSRLTAQEVGFILNYRANKDVE